METVFKEFTEKRVDDAHAICDLAMYNYVEVNRNITFKNAPVIKVENMKFVVLKKASFVPHLIKIFLKETLHKPHHVIAN